MARGQRTNLAELAGDVGANSPVDRLSVAASNASLQLPLKDLVANPRNPRDDLGTLDDLASIADLQLQPAVAVTKKAYLKLYPDDDIKARYVVVNGCRRLAAAHKYGRVDLAVIVNDEIARDRITLVSACITENVDRQDFDIIEEAKAVEALVAECATAGEAARRLRKTDGWVSQRRALLTLAPELQAALRRGELAVRDARSLARVPYEEQVARWRAAQDKKNDGPDEGDKRPPRSQTQTRIITAALAEFHARPQTLAEALKTHLGPEGVAVLVALWSDDGPTAITTN
jgi:ParB family chromosome partitioning protein